MQRLLKELCTEEAEDVSDTTYANVGGCEDEGYVGYVGKDQAKEVTWENTTYKYVGECEVGRHTRDCCGRCRHS